MQHLLTDNPDGRLYRICDDLIDPTLRHAWFDMPSRLDGRPLNAVNPLTRFRALLLLRRASQKRGVAGKDGRCVACSTFAAVCGQIGEWADENALMSPYHVLKGNTLTQCVSLEQARQEADVYRNAKPWVEARGKLEDSSDMIRQTLATTGVAKVYVKVSTGGLVDTDELAATLTNDDRPLKTLTPREEEVLRLRFGIDRPIHGLEEIARRVGLSTERVCEVEAKGLRKLTQTVRTNGA